MQRIHFYLATVLITSSLVGVLQASLALADEPPAQSTPSTATEYEADKGTGAQEEPGQPAEAGEVQERGFTLSPKVAPSGTLQPLGLLGPTPSLTAVANAIRVTSKSVSVNLRIPPNLLAVTVPVEVSVAYISPAQAQRRTETYNRTAGLTILYHEAEGDGKPRAVRLDITTRELVPNGKSFSISKQFTVTPLYQATISPLRFNMATKCDTVGKSDITFQWRRVGGQEVEQKFDLGFGETKMVNLFNEGRREFSTEANLREPVMRFDERDPTLPGSTYHPPFGYSDKPLVPGPTKEFSFFLDEGKMGPPPTQHSGSTNCKAHISYRIDRKLMTFDQFGAGTEGSQIR
jgi:hypothetical protein